MDVTNYIKGLAEGYAHQSKNRSFEERHLEDVAKYTLVLCQSRGLSIEMGLAIAYGHDLGRLKNGVLGKKHSKEGAKIMKLLLRASDFTQKEKKQIIRAIEKHNQKDKIHGRYAELIKDADSLAHYKEDMIEIQDQYENTRITALENEMPKILAAPWGNWKQTGDKCLQKVVRIVNDEVALQAHSEFWVHDLRVAIRKLRSILWVVKAIECPEIKETAVVADQVVKKIAKRLDSIRLHQVILQKVPLGTQDYQFYQQKVSLGYKEIQEDYDWPNQMDALTKLFRDLSEQFEDLPEVEYLPEVDLQKICEGLLNLFFKQAASKKLNQQRSLHALRITTKKLKYLAQLGLVELTPDLFKETNSELSRLIGEANDIFEIQKVMKAPLFEGTLETLMKDIDWHVFLQRKMKDGSIPKELW